MRRIAALLALTVGASLLAGCVYDPYTATWRPCCNYYGYPYYRYPPSYYPYGYPPGPYMAPKRHLKVSRVHIQSQPAEPPPRPGAANYLLPGMPMVAAELRCDRPRSQRLRYIARGARLRRPTARGT